MSDYVTREEITAEKCGICAQRFGGKDGSGEDHLYVCGATHHTLERLTVDQFRVVLQICNGPYREDEEPHSFPILSYGMRQTA